MPNFDRDKEKKDGLFSKIIVVCMFLLLIGFVIWVMLVFSRTGMEPVTLIISVFALFTGQFGFLHLLTKQRRQLKHEEDILEEPCPEETEYKFDELVFEDTNPPIL